MTTHIKGTPEFKRRLKAIRTETFKPLAQKWQDETVRLARERVPNRNTRWSKGKLHDSIQPKATAKGRRSQSAIEARVTFRYTGYFVDAGTRGHGLHSRASRTVFSRKARKRGNGGYAARPFRTRSAQDAFRKFPFQQVITEAWNRAA